MLRAVAICLALLPLTACGQAVGDACDSTADCDTGQICDITSPGGYCTRNDCVIQGCPEEAVCVSFSAFDHYCMLRCDKDSECRSEYQCVADTALAPAAFCGRVEATAAGP